MTPEEQAALDQLRDNYDAIHDHLDALLEACGEDVSLKHQVGDAMEEALQSYIRAQTHILNQSQELVAQINAEARDAQDAIDKALADLKHLKETLNNITKAVKIVGIVVAALP